MTQTENRCRLVLVAPEIADAAQRAGVVADALRGGDVASVIVPQYGLAADAFQRHAEALVPVIQAAGAAALIDGDTRIAGRAKADGLHIAGTAEAIGEAVEKHAPRLIVGAGNVTSRHQALEIGDAGPDYVFFGRTDGDVKPEAHPKMLELAEWWASMIELPCIAMGGTDVQSVVSVAATGAEFVALRLAVFADPAEAALKVAEANALLDEKAPRFDAE
ncbi:thiamine phosphate synthase [Ensifer soli]|uniref:thiamine phosphate synthase n=1 Tax=Ciceribacter sp. sgz301302 TaxID=3342379 RepID=UPI0035B88013